MTVNQIREIIKQEFFELRLQHLQELQRKRLIKRGKLRRRIQCPPGMKVNSKGTGCTVKTAKERLNRSIAAKKAIKKRIAKKAASLRKYRKSLRRRKTLGL